MEEIKTKTCKVCGKDLPLSEFHRTRNGGYRDMCKCCYSARMKEAARAKKKETKAAEAAEPHPAFPGLNNTDEVLKLSALLDRFCTVGMALWGFMPIKKEDCAKAAKYLQGYPSLREIFSLCVVMRDSGERVSPAAVALQFQGISVAAYDLIANIGNKFYAFTEDAEPHPFPSITYDGDPFHYLSDTEICDELRRRGWHVVATKTIQL